MKTNLDFKQHIQLIISDHEIYRKLEMYNIMVVVSVYHYWKVKIVSYRRQLFTFLKLLRETITNELQEQNINDSCLTNKLLTVWLLASEQCFLPFRAFYVFEGTL